ncbi:MAG TPA: MBL fold metallo-hydrolase [Burkholderiaceae bacterium]|nr:MBL fold metallo-hydrolase [Burkholderiaceae bacterium]
MTLKMNRKWILGLAAGAAVLAAAMASLAWADRPLRPDAFAPLAPIPAQLPEAKPPQGLSFTVFETSRSAGTLEALIVGGGSWLTLRQPVHMAVLVRHPAGDLLFDTGLGRNVAQQFAVNSWLDRQFFGFKDVNPVVEQLARHGLPARSISLVVPSHMHWDHISALPDFPEAQVWVAKAEREQAAQGAAPAFLASQFAGVQNWRDLTFNGPAYLGFPASRDVHGDGSVVLVPLSGHTAGQVGMFLNLPSGQRYFFTADVTWTLDGFQRPADRSWLARAMVHLDREERANQAVIVQIHRLMKAHPALKIIPAHDERVAKALPRFPAFQK